MGCVWCALSSIPTCGETENIIQRAQRKSLQVTNVLLSMLCIIKDKVPHEAARCVMDKGDSGQIAIDPGYSIKLANLTEKTFNLANTTAKKEAAKETQRKVPDLVKQNSDAI